MASRPRCDADAVREAGSGATAPACDPGVGRRAWSGGRSARTSPGSPTAARRKDESPDRAAPASSAICTTASRIVSIDRRLEQRLRALAIALAEIQWVAVDRMVREASITEPPLRDAPARRGRRRRVPCDQRAAAPARAHLHAIGIVRPDQEVNRRSLAKVRGEIAPSVAQRRPEWTRPMSISRYRCAIALPLTITATSAGSVNGCARTRSPAARRAVARSSCGAPAHGRDR